MVEASYLLDLAWNVAVVLGLVFLNGFFVAAEFAIVKVRASQLETLAPGPRREAAKHATLHLDAYLSACQVGITIASLGLGWIGEPAVSHFIVEPALGPYIADPDVVRSVSFGIAFFIITALHIVVGELAPKSIAIQRAQSTALWVSLPLRAFGKLFSPLIWLMNGSANLLIRGLGLRAATSGEHDYTVDELRLLLAQVRSVEKTESRSARVAGRVFGLQDIQLKSIMVPREKMVFLDIDRPFEENFHVVKQSPFTRFPLTDGGPDSILGFVHQRDVFAASETSPRPALESLRRDIHVAPASQRASGALFDMLEKRRQIAVVVGDQGVTLGIVTLEDILEEVVGDIPGEFDRTEARLRVLAPGRYLVDGSLPVQELQLVLKEPIEVGQARTLSALLAEKLARAPSKGDTLRLGLYEYTVLEADAQQVRQVRLRRLDGPAGGPAPSGGPTSGA